MMRATSRSNPPGAKPNCAVVGNATNQSWCATWNSFAGSFNRDCKSAQPRLEQSKAQTRGKQRRRQQCVMRERKGIGLMED